MCKISANMLFYYLVSRRIGRTGRRLTCRYMQKSKSFVHFYQNFKKLTVKSARVSFVNKMATPVTEDFANFDAKLSLNNPMPDYLKLMDEKMKADVIMSSDIYDECWRKISAAAREAMWKILFDDKQKPTKEQLDKVAELMKMHKEDACFYQASEYNKWIVKVRDELLKRNILEFWKNEIVEKELGPCWARDSDLFDDTEDPEPAKFYKFAGCEAVWLKKKSENQTQATAAPILAATLLNTPDTAPKTTKTLKKISLETPLEDYKYNIQTQGEIDGDDEYAYKKIFSEARKMIWELLFSQTPLTSENSKKAAALLDEYKRDACFYSPYDYNDWIQKVRDELLKRKYFDFWQNIIVARKLGLCWARDSDYFDDLEDTKPDEFYKSGDDLIKQHKSN